MAVLVRPKFHFPSQLVSTVLAGLMNKGRFVKPASVDVHLPDPKDIIFYAVTLESMKTNETYLVTGNAKHFPVEPFIVTPKELVEILKGK